MGWIGFIVRFIVSGVVLWLVAAFLPGISVSGFAGAFTAAAVIAIAGFLFERILGDNISPQGRGIVGFATSAVVIYFAQFVIPASLTVSIIGALLTAFAVGLIDAFVPTLLR